MNQRLHDMSIRAAQLRGLATARRQAADEAVARRDALLKDKAALEAAVAVVQRVAADTQNQLRVRLRDITQTALDIVFPGAYTFMVEFVTKAGRTELDMWLDKDGTRLDPLDSNGGGVVDVLSLALRVCCLTMSGNDRVLLLDEPFKHIREAPRRRLGDMLKALSRRLGIQVIMVADVSDTGIVPDKEFHVGMRNRHSVVTGRTAENTEV